MFEKVSGLKANSEKTTIYFGNVEERVKHNILSLTGFVEGSTPFKYLGVPLNSRYLKVSDFDALIDKMLHKLKGWSSRNLSYIAIVVLIKSVLISLHSYWAQSVLFPKYVCKSKKVGGLAKKKDSLWVKWVHNVYVKSADWWSYAPKKADGWAWKKICKIKDELREGCLTEKWEEKNYSIAAVYSWFQGAGEKVGWTDWVWNRYNIPKTSFIAWLAMLNKLRTRDKLFKHGVCDTDKRLLCDTVTECQQHLFFACPYSRRCILIISRWLGIQEAMFNGGRSGSADYRWKMEKTSLSMAIDLKKQYTSLSW
ncbi:uncharacterized protein LOC110709204 [Chenopodium quinoa]|uniref:uncharacterized protein LOC110709204 n=1 Tax=Chenopodium quinoa TaxID=63459 RepID=UPI000B787745|nr:uncharacterized protein LOC110709204 [Chenopodium quinoa]